MPDARVRWTPVPTEFPEGTPAAHHYTASLGALSADAPLTATFHLFPDVPPGDYQSKVDTVAADGTIIASQIGNVLHVPAPVLIPLATSVLAELVA